MILQNHNLMEFCNMRIQTKCGFLMKNIWFLLIIITIVNINLTAKPKTDANLFGHVVNKTTNEHIPYITVSIKGTTLGTYTDKTGHYFLKNLPEGKYIVMVKGLGYKTIEKEIELKSDVSLELNFEIEIDAIMMEGVVVSATKSESNRKESSTVVNVISPTHLENTNSVCLAQGLNFQPGLRVENSCQNCGTTQVRINGLDGPYSQIHIDNRPIFSSLAGVYGIEQIPVNMIERVEVIRGGGSALFGSSAIGGVINVITKEPTSNFINLSNTTSFILGRTSDINTNLNSSFVSDDSKAAITIFGSTRQRNYFDYDGDGFSEMPKLESKNLGFRGYYKLSDFSKLTLEYHNLGEFRRGGNKFDLPPHQADIAEQLEHNINTAGLSYNIFTSDVKHQFNIYLSTQSIDRKSYYGAQKNLDAYGTTTDQTYIVGLQYNHYIDYLLFMPSEFITGAEYLANVVSDKMLGYKRDFNQKVDIKSFFLQNEWKNETIDIVIGGRLDKHNMVDNPILSPRINIRYAPLDWVNIRTSYSAGFRAPQAFDEDLHVTAVGGGVGIITVDSNLKTEKSQSISASLDFYYNFGEVQTNILIEGFRTSLNNIFVLEEIGTSDGVTNLLRTNGSGALVQGINLEGRIAPSEHWQIQFGLTLQQSEYTEPQKWSDNESLQPEKRMFRSPNSYGYFTSAANIYKVLDLSLTGTYTGSMLVQHFAGYIDADREVITPDFFDLNIRLNYSIAINSNFSLQLNSGIQNIFNSFQSDFDKGEFRDAGYIYGPSLPRTFFVGAKLLI